MKYTNNGKGTIVGCHHNVIHPKFRKKVKQLSSIVKLKFLLSLLLSISILVSCDHAEVDGVFIDHTLYENLTIPKQIELKRLIRQTLNKDETALAKLNKFWCGGGAGCYELGFIVTQIIYRIGEDEFIKMVVKLDRKEYLGLEGLIAAGLEYGDNNKDEKMDNKKIETEFPKLNKILLDKYNSK